MLSSRLVGVVVAALAVARTLGAQQDDANRALEWFISQRAFPLGGIPAGARQSAMAAMFARWPQAQPVRRLSAGNAGAAGTPWVALGPAPIGTGTNTLAGRINTIAVDPTNSQIILVGGATGGVWRTLNGGLSWTAMTDDQCGLAMGSITIDPVNPLIIYAGTGEQNGSIDSYLGCGVLRSTDGGLTWQQLGAASFVPSVGQGAQVSRVLVDRTSAGSPASTIVLAATSRGLLRSTTSGLAWTTVLAGRITDLVADPSQPLTLYAAVSGAGVQKSSDGGVTWAPLSVRPSGTFGRINIGISPSAPTVLYAAFDLLPNHSFALFRTLDAGATWAQLPATNASCGAQCWYDLAVTVDPAVPGTVYFSGFSLYKSVDSGSTFVDIGRSVHVDHHTVAFDPQVPTTMYAGSDGGIFKSANSGGTFASLNGNLALAQFYPGIAVNPVNPNAIIGGTQDNGTLEWGGSSAWPVLQGGDGAAAAYDFKSGTTAFMSFTSGSSTLGPLRRDAGTSFFAYRSSGINTSDRSSWVPPMTMDNVNPKVLYYGTYRLYRTETSGDAWTIVSPDLTSGTGSLNTIAVARADTQTIYVGTSDGLVQVTTDLGATWKNVRSNLPLRSVTKIVVDPLDPQTAWVTLSGYNTGHVFKTVNRGASWTDISFDLPNAPVNAVVLERGSRDLAVGTDLGVFLLPDGAASWAPLTGGMPNTVVMDLVYDGPRGRLVAATHGRGMYSLAVSPAVLRGNITATGALSALDAQAILAAVVGLPLPAGARRFPNGDANCDGDVTAADALLVLSKLVGLNTTAFCVGVVR
jgi:photosystem II stability/assembly factor-like uncharacterized protein